MAWLEFLVFLVGVVVVVIAVHSRFLTQFMAPSCELRQHRNDAAKHRLALDIVLTCQHVASFETVLNGGALQG